MEMASSPTATSPSDKKALWSLQAGRAFAALAVVVHHASLAARDFAAPLPLQPLFEAGYLGVDFFFVLSGFIIAYTTIGRNRTIGGYALARFVRVYLPYWPVGIGIAALYVLLPQLSAGDRTWSWLASATLLPIKAETALSVAWTLKHEVLFYTIFAVLHFARVLKYGLFAWVVAIILTAVGGLDAGIPLATINLEFVAGIFAAQYFRRAGKIWFVAAVLPLAAWLILGGQRSQSVLVGLCFAALLMPIARQDWEGRLSVPKILKFLGNASYSIYLAHGLAISIIARLIWPDNWLILTAGCLGGTLAGIAYHLAVERPLLKVGHTPQVARRLPSGD